MEAGQPVKTQEEYFNLLIQKPEINTNLISDGYHTFGELYEHRITNYISLCRVLALSEQRDDSIYINVPVWRSKRHSDGELIFGGEWFILGVNKKLGRQITYHLPIKDWDKTEFAETLQKAPEYDGHTSQDVLERLSQL